jgi:hypothetical protein
MTPASTGQPAAAASSSVEPFISDDFYPLQTAATAILDALRADEVSPDADLVKRLAFGGAGGHGYRIGERVSSTAKAAAARSGASTVAGGSPGAQPPLQLPGTRSPTPHTPGNGGVAIPVHVPRTPPTASVRHSRTVPLPPILARELGSTRLSSLMGLLPRASLAWMSVDERMYVWQCSDDHSGGNGGGGAAASAVGGGSAEDVCSFSVPSGQCIVSVGLVRPKKGKEATQREFIERKEERACICCLI